MSNENVYESLGTRKDVRRRYGVDCFECGKKIHMGDSIWIEGEHDHSFCSRKCYDKHIWRVVDPGEIVYQGIFDEKILDYFETEGA